MKTTLTYKSLTDQTTASGLVDSDQSTMLDEQPPQPQVPRLPRDRNDTTDETDRDLDQPGHDKFMVFKTLDEQIKHVFRTAISTDFEDGMESGFSRTIVAILQEHGAFALESLSTLIREKLVESELVAEMLRWLGSMDDVGTHEERRALLEECLQHSSYLVREGAIGGLSCLEDAASTSAVRHALAVEPHSELAEDLNILLNDLENAD